MKKLLFKLSNLVIILPIILLSLFAIQSCSDDFDDVPISYPKVDFKANTSISQMKALFKSSKTLITDDAIVEGYVISDDTQGNFYKAIHIQNAEGTEGFKLNLDIRGIGNSYPVGQKVLIKLKGLAINNNNGYEVGKFGEGNRIDRILEPEANQYLFRSEEPIKITPRTIKISDFTEKDLNTLVKLDDVQFETTGETYALEGKNTNRTILACSDNSKVVLRTSGYSTFWNETVADKKGTITAVLSKYGSTYQLYIRDLSDISFKEERCGSSVTPPTTGGGANNSSTSFSDDFEAGSGKPKYTPVEGWTNLATKDTRQFTYKTFKENSYAEVGSHKAKGDIEAWLISPKVDLTKATNTDMSFDTQSAYADSSQAKLAIYYSEDYDGNGAPDSFTWVKVSDITDASNPSGNTGSWIGGTAKLPKKAVFVAFKYNGNGSSATSTWRIDNVKIPSSATSGGTTTKNSDAIVSGFSLTEESKAAVIDNTKNTVSIEVKKGTDITKLTPTITISDKATINPTGAQDFTNPVKYTVTAEDGTTKDWTVTVSVDSGTTPPPSNEITSFSDDFETGSGAAKNTAPEKWSNVAQEGDRKFSYKTFQNNTYSQLGAYKANGNVTGWMISPKIDLTNVSDTNMTFDTQAAYADSNQAKLTLLYSEDYDGGDSPQNFTWTELSNITDPSNPAKNTGSWIGGNANLPKKIIFVAFKYEGNSNSATSSWRIDNVKIPSSATGGGTTTKNSDADIASLSLTEEFAAATISSGAIDITVKSGTDITKLTPTITISDKATINPTGAQDFTNPVKYTVTAEDGTTKDWTVTVTIDDGTTPPPTAGTIYPNLKGAELRSKLRTDYKSHTVFSYGTARSHLYGEIDVKDGKLETIYTGQRYTPTSNTNKAYNSYKVNCEHSWPQGSFGKKKPMVSDLHHLFASNVKVNGDRGHLYFGEVNDNATTNWYWQTSRSSNKPSSNIDNYSERGQGKFEPRESRKGDIARAQFYMATMYGKNGKISGGYDYNIKSMLKDLKNWNKIDPVDDYERQRNQRVKSAQKNLNPFILDPTLADRAFTDF